MCMLHLCYLAKSDAQRKLLDTHVSAHCKSATLLSQRHRGLQRAHICVHVVILQNWKVEWHRGHHSADVRLHGLLVFFLLS